MQHSTLPDSRLEFLVKTRRLSRPLFSVETANTLIVGSHVLSVSMSPGLKRRVNNDGTASLSFEVNLKASLIALCLKIGALTVSSSLLVRSLMRITQGRCLRIVDP
jgi:hypothetical protein